MDWGSPPGQSRWTVRSAEREGVPMSTVLMVGTRKGLWIGTSDDARAGLGVHRPAPRHGGGLLLPDRHPRRQPAAARRLPRPAGSARRYAGTDDLGATWQETPDGAIRFPEDDERRRSSVWQLAAGRRATGSCTPAPSPARSGAPSDGGESFALERASGTTRSGPSGARASAARRSTRSSRTRPTRQSVTVGDLDRRRLPDRRRRRLVGSRATRASGRSSSPRASSTRSSASACTR